MEIMFKTYDETLDFLYHNLPMFQRIGAPALKFDLNNTIALCEVLDNPHLKFKSIHIAGTNGKGSTSHMLASILQSAGFKTGLYTSPHLKSFTERIRINGEEISRDYVVAFMNRIFPQVDKLKPSFFEITVAMAFDYFADEQVDVAVIEVGLGGRLDSTNVITPELSLITNIGWDHTDILGDTLEKIAEEKAGIIKPGVAVVISERQRDIEQIFQRKALALGSPLFYATDKFKATIFNKNGVISMDIFERENILFKDLILPLQGSYQQKNVPGVLAALNVLRDQGWKIPAEQVRYGLENVVEQTGLKGRWQILSKMPLVVCDTGHNLDGIREVLRQIKEQSYENLYFVFGVVKDKDASPILQLLPKEAYYFFCQAKIARALDASSLFEQAEKYQLTGEVVPDVNEAIQAATKKAKAKDMIFIGGSTYVVAEIDAL